MYLRKNGSRRIQTRDCHGAVCIRSRASCGHSPTTRTQILAYLCIQWQRAARPPRPEAVAARRIISLAVDAPSVRRDTTRSASSCNLFLSVFYIANMFASIYRRLCRSPCFKCDEIYPTCSNCKRLNSSCSLSASESPTDSELVERQLNIEDLQLLHDWHMGNATRFSDHSAEESFRRERGREIDLGFQHPYGEFLKMHR